MDISLPYIVASADILCKIRPDKTSGLIWIKLFDILMGNSERFLENISSEKKKINRQKNMHFCANCVLKRLCVMILATSVKPVLSGHLKRRPQIGFQDRLLLNVGQKYCRMLQGEHSSILSTFIKLPFVINIFVLSIFEWLLKTGFTVWYFINS